MADPSLFQNGRVRGGEIRANGIPPVAHLDSQRLGLRAIQYGPQRSGGVHLQLIGANALYTEVFIAGPVQARTRELPPRRHSVIGHVVDALRAALHEEENRLRQVVGVGGAPVLIVHHAQRSARPPGALFAALSENRRDEIAPLAKEPAGPHDQRIRCSRQHLLFTRELGAPIDGARLGLVLLAVGDLRVSGKNVVGGNVHQPDPTLITRLGEYPGRDRVAPLCGFGLPLASIHLSECRGVDCNIRRIGSEPVEEFCNCLRIGEIHFVAIDRGDDLTVGVRGQALDERVPELPPTTCNQPSRCHESSPSTQVGNFSAVSSRRAVFSASGRVPTGPTRTRQLVGLPSDGARYTV